MNRTEWDKRFHDLMERTAATVVAGGDPRLLTDELKKLMAEMPSEKNDAKSQLV